MGEKTKEKKNIAGPEGETQITIPKSAWESMQRDMDAMKRNNEMLFKIADKKALSRYYQRHKKDLPLIVCLRELNGKVIVGWDKMITNKVQKIADNKWITDQRVKLIYEDGTTDEMNYQQFQESYNLVQCKREGVIQSGNLIAYNLIRLDNGKKYKIDVRFVN